MKRHLLALLLTIALFGSMFPVALAASDEMIDAKDELASVDITQTVNGTEGDRQVYNYDLSGSEVDIVYSATLKMTEEMAIYLQARQSQLLNAKFNVHVEIDADEDAKALEFTGEGEYLTVTLSSPFLKPWDVCDEDIVRYPEAFGGYRDRVYTHKFLGCEEGMFYYEVYLEREWAQQRLEETGCFDIPMELIVYFDGTMAYSYEDLPSGVENEKPMFYDYTVEDWIRTTTVTCAELRVQDGVRESVTHDSATWRRITAQGTIDGEFTYERYHKINTLADYAKTFYTETMEFGNDFATDEDIIEEWVSDYVWTYLIREEPTQPPRPPLLNLDDHFAYIIGYPGGNVSPTGTITRAEVATIFFRMLNDDVRNEFWSKTNEYTDVKSTDWFNNAVSTLSNMGIVNGKPDGGFHPNDPITRAEFAAIAARFFVVEPGSEVPESPFSDIAGHWANQYINLAYHLKVISGYPDGTYRPNNPILRAEAMTIVNNTLRRTPTREGISPMNGHTDLNIWPDNMDTNKWYYAAVQEATNSHEYLAGDKETWTDILPVRDWAAFEKAWSDANAAENPGEVVDEP